MTNDNDDFFAAVRNAASQSMNARQAPLTALYAEDGRAAHITDCARTSSDRVPASAPLHGEVFAAAGNKSSYPVGVHRAVGGDSDFPTPGDILCAAAAACLDSCIRIITNKVGIELKSLAVDVTGEIDVRGTLCVDQMVPVGFQKINVNVALEPKTAVPPEHIDAILKAAEHSCVILQTLRNSPSVSISRINKANSEAA